MSAAMWLVFGGGVVVGVLIALAGIAVGTFIDRAARLAGRGGRLVRRCAECGCTDGLPCRSGCVMVGPTACSRCDPDGARGRHPAGRALQGRP